MNHEEKLNEVYRQRNALAVALAKMTIQSGGHAGKGIDGEPHPDQRDGWGWVVYVDTPAGQVSWHMSPESVHLLEDLPLYRAPWNGTFLARNNDWPLQWHLAPEDPSAGLWGRIAGQAMGRALNAESNRDRYADLLNQLIEVSRISIPDDTAWPLTGPDLCAVAMDLISKIAHADDMGEAGIFSLLNQATAIINNVEKSLVIPVTMQTDIDAFRASANDMTEEAPRACQCGLFHQSPSLVDGGHFPTCARCHRRIG